MAQEYIQFVDIQSYRERPAASTRERRRACRWRTSSSRLSIECSSVPRMDSSDSAGVSGGMVHEPTVGPDEVTGYMVSFVMLADSDFPTLSNMEGQRKTGPLV